MKPAEDAVSDEFDHLLVWYSGIRNRQHRGQRFEPISLEAIAVYETRVLGKLGIEMSAFDWDMLFRLDHVWMESVPKETETTPPSRRPGPPPRSR